MVAQRKFIRKSISRSCQVVIDGVVVNGATVDLSASGCSIALDENINYDAEGEVLLILPVPEIDIVGLAIPICIVWVSGSLIGAEFEHKSVKIKGLYYKFLKLQND